MGFFGKKNDEVEKKVAGRDVSLDRDPDRYSDWGDDEYIDEDYTSSDKDSYRNFMDMPFEDLLTRYYNSNNTKLGDVDLRFVGDLVDRVSNGVYEFDREFDRIVLSAATGNAVLFQFLLNDEYTADYLDEYFKNSMSSFDVVEFNNFLLDPYNFVLELYHEKYGEGLTNKAVLYDLDQFLEVVSDGYAHYYRLPIGVDMTLVYIANRDFRLYELLLTLPYTREFVINSDAYVGEGFSKSYELAVKLYWSAYYGTQGDLFKYFELCREHGHFLILDELNDVENELNSFYLDEDYDVDGLLKTFRDLVLN